MSEHKCGAQFEMPPTKYLTKNVYVKVQNKLYTLTLNAPKQIWLKMKIQMPLNKFD
jgi:hypothetical protein